MAKPFFFFFGSLSDGSALFAAVLPESCGWSFSELLIWREAIDNDARRQAKLVFRGPKVAVFTCFYNDFRALLILKSDESPDV